MQNEWKPVYLDIQHLENMCIRYYQANERNMAEKIQAQSELQKAQARIADLEKGHLILNQALFDAGETEGRLRRSYDIQKKSLDSIVKERDQLKLDLEIVRDSHKRQCELNTKVHARLVEADSILSSISDPTWSDERLSYVEVQISREDYKKLQEYLAKRGKNG